jgi:hypothetical protein
MIKHEVGERNAPVMRIRDIFSQSFAVTICLGEDEMSDIVSLPGEETNDLFSLSRQPKNSRGVNSHEQLNSPVTISE